MNNNNLKVFGDGSYSGGTYGTITVFGNADFANNIETSTYKVRGDSTVNGNATAKTLSILGNLTITGNANIEHTDVYGDLDINSNAEINSAKINGSCKINGDAKILDNKLNGTLEIKGNYKGEIANIKGELTVGSDVEVEKFTSSGSFHISGLLNAEEINIHPHHSKSYVREIGGEKITIRKRNELSTLFTLATGIGGKVITDMIEGDDIYLEHTTAKIVRGRNVEIGPNCEVDTVECSGEYKESGNSIVKERL